MISLEIEEDWFFGNFSSHFCAWEMRESKNHRQASQKEFYKWINHSGITAENCPEKLKHFLNQINETLENGQSQLYQDYKVAKEKHDIFTLNESPFFVQASREVNKAFGFKSSSSEAEWLNNKPKYYTAKIKGNAEAGEKTFSQIKSSITSQPEWDFSFMKEYYQKLKEKIRELEEKGQPSPKEKPEPKNSLNRELYLDTIKDTLRTVELYIQKLNLYPDWKISEWNEKYEDWRKNWENASVEKIEGFLRVDLKGLTLMLREAKKNDLDYYPHLINELKTELSQWQSERKINPVNCPQQLNQILVEINQVLEGSWKWKKHNNGEDKEEKISEIIFEIKLKIAEFTKEYKIKISQLGSQFVNWEKKLMNMESISEANHYRQQIEEKIQEEKKKHNSPVANNKLSLPAKIAIGTVIIGLVIGIIIIVYRIVKKEKK